MSLQTCRATLPLPGRASASPAPRPKAALPTQLSAPRGLSALTRPARAAPAPRRRSRQMTPQAVARPSAPIVAATASEPAPTAFETFSTYFTNLFPLWNIFGAALALKQPAAYAFMSTDYFTAALSILMFSMGITMTLDDFKRCAQQPGPIAINFIACYLMMPALALGIAKLFGLGPALVAGCVLVGSINGGQASNLCTYIAKVRPIPTVDNPRVPEGVCCGVAAPVQLSGQGCQVVRPPVSAASWPLSAQHGAHCHRPHTTPGCQQRVWSGSHAGCLGRPWACSWWESGGCSGEDGVPAARP